MTLLIAKQNRRTEANIIIQNYKKNKINVLENEKEVIFEKKEDCTNYENLLLSFKNELIENINKENEKEIKECNKIFRINLYFLNINLIKYFLLEFKKYSEENIEIKIVNKKTEEIHEIILKQKEQIFYLKKENFDEIFLIVNKFFGVLNIKIKGVI